MLLFRKSNGGKPILFRSINTDLRLAACQGDVEEVAELLKRGAKFIPDKDGRTVLHLATINGHSSIVQMLIEHGCDLNHKDKLGYTALHRACFDGFDEIVRLLLDANAKIDEQDVVRENTALHKAATRGHAGCVELFLKAKANVYIRNKTGATALHLACQNGFNQPCKLLIQHGCKLNVKDKYDDTPLHTTCRYLHVSVAKIILLDSNHINEQNKNGDTPLHLSTNLGHRKLSKLLIENGASVNIRNKQGETALDIAIRKQQSELVDLFKHGHSKQITKQSELKFDKRLKSRIRERLKLSQQDPDSTWKVLFQDWPDDGTCNQMHKASLMINSSGQKPNLGSTGHTADVNGPINSTAIITASPKKVIPCNCAPFFYRLARHADEAHRELLEEIDACHMNLNGEICDLRQITERKLTDLNNSIKMRLLRERANCTQRIKKHLEPSSARKLGSKIRVMTRCKSESELETDAERAHLVGVKKRVDSEEIMQTSLRGKAFDYNWPRAFPNNMEEMSKNKLRSAPLRRKYAPGRLRHILSSQKSKRPQRNNDKTQQSTNDETSATIKNRLLNKTVSEFDRLVTNTTTTMDEDSTENFNESERASPIGQRRVRNAAILTSEHGDSLYSCQSNDSSSPHPTVNNRYNETVIPQVSSADRRVQTVLVTTKHRYQPPSVDSGYGTKLETLSSSSPMRHSSLHASLNSASITADPAPSSSLNCRRQVSVESAERQRKQPEAVDLRQPQTQITNCGQSLNGRDDDVSVNYDRVSATANRNDSALTRSPRWSSYSDDEYDFALMSRAKSDEYVFDQTAQGTNRKGRTTEQSSTLGRWQRVKALQSLASSINRSFDHKHLSSSAFMSCDDMPPSSTNHKRDAGIIRTDRLLCSSYSDSIDQSASDQFFASKNQAKNHFLNVVVNRKSPISAQCRISKASVSTESSDNSNNCFERTCAHAETQTDQFESYSDGHEYTELEQLMKCAGSTVKNVQSPKNWSSSFVGRRKDNKPRASNSRSAKSPPVLIIPPPPTKPLPPVPYKIAKNLKTYNVTKSKYTTNV